MIEAPNTLQELQPAINRLFKVIDVKIARLPVVPIPSVRNSNFSHMVAATDCTEEMLMERGEMHCEAMMVKVLWDACAAQHTEGRRRIVWRREPEIVRHFDSMKITMRMRASFL